MSYTGYSHYKESNVKWLGEIPAQWDIRRLKLIADVQLSNVDKHTVEEEDRVFLCNYVDVYKNEKITPFLEFMRASASDEQIKKLTLTSGDVLITKDSETADDIAVPALVTHDLPSVVCGYHLALVRPRPGVLLGAFLHRFFQSSFAQANYSALATGVTRFGLGKDSITNARIVLPSFEEQQAIARFLDLKTAEIDEVIGLRQQHIELLNKKRQALIDRVVTRGLDSAAELQDSGIAWLGDIPRHWRIKRLKFQLDSIEQGWSPPCENRKAEQEEWGVLKVGCVNGDHFDENENKALPPDLEPRLDLEIRTGDVLMSRANTRELLGSASIVGNVRPRLLLCDKLYRLNPKSAALDRHYLVWFLSSSMARFQIEREATGASDSMQNIGQDTVRNLLLPVSGIEEQRANADYLNHETSYVEGIAQAIQTQIDKLRQHRRALISAAVTGKIDVRGWAI